MTAGFCEVSIGPLTVSLIASGDVIVKQLRAGQGFEPATLAMWADLCAAGGTVLDIGAYTGLFSIVAAKLGCHVIAIEPMPKHAARCRENFVVNGVEVDLRHACASNYVGEVDIKFNPRVPGLTSGASLIRPSGGRESRNLPSRCLTIDSLGLPQVTAIKIDVERGEPLVLAGARETLARCRPSMIVEVLGEAEMESVREAVPDYWVAETMDVRNWLMRPSPRPPHPLVNGA